MFVLVYFPPFIPFVLLHLLLMSDVCVLLSWSTFVHSVCCDVMQHMKRGTKRCQPELLHVSRWAIIRAVLNQTWTHPTAGSMAVCGSAVIFTAGVDTYKCAPFYFCTQWPQCLCYSIPVQCTFLFVIVVCRALQTKRLCYRVWFRRDLNHFACHILQWEKIVDLLLNL